MKWHVATDGKIVHAAQQHFGGLDWKLNESNQLLKTYWFQYEMSAIWNQTQNRISCHVYPDVTNIPSFTENSYEKKRELTTTNSWKWMECSRNGPSNRAWFMLLNVTFLQWIQPFLGGRPQSHVGSIIRPLITEYVYALGEKRYPRNLRAMKPNFSPQRKQHSFPHRKDFLALTWLSAIINAHQQLGCVPHFHTIRD